MALLTVTEHRVEMERRTVMAALMAQAAREEILRAVNHLKNRMETAAREETRQAANLLKNRITTTDEVQKCSGPLQARFFRTDGRVHDNSLLQYKNWTFTFSFYVCNFRYFEHYEKYFYFFVKYI
jgi:hypothetical protein